MNSLTIPRTDSICTSKSNAYNSPTNQQILSNISIREDLLNPFLIRLTRCTTFIFFRAIFIFIICMFIIPALMLGFEYLTLNSIMSTEEILFFCLPYLIYLELLCLALIVIYIIAHRQMLRKAQHIINLENNKQGIYKFSLSPVSLALNIVMMGDAERGLVNQSTEPLKEIIAFPGFKKADEYLKLNYFNAGDNVYNTYVAVHTEVTALNKKYICYGVVVGLFVGITIAATAIITVNNVDNLLDCSLIILGVSTFMGLAMYAFNSVTTTQMKECIERRNLEINQFGLCIDFTSWMVYIYVFEPLGINGSYKNDLRTAKYFD
jgi:hypothetical protein